MIKNELKATQKNQSAEKTMHIIEYLADQDIPTRLIDISQALDLNISTTLRFISTLVTMGYVSQDANSAKYFLTYKICAIGNKVSHNTKLNQISESDLRSLSRIVGESVCIAVEQNQQVVYINVFEGSDQMIRTMQRIGNVAPLHCTGIGKLFLLNYSPEELDSFFRQSRLEKYTEHTLTTKSALQTELKKIQERGYAFDNEECEIGARCIAFPIYDYTGKIISGFSVTGPTSRLTDEFVQKWLPTFQETAQTISSQLGFN